MDERHEWERREDVEENVMWGLIGGAAVLLLLWAVSLNPGTNQQVATNDLPVNPPAAVRNAPDW